MEYVLAAGVVGNALLVVWAVRVLLAARGDLGDVVESAIQEEVRRQDDRIEKRAQRARGPAEDADGTPQELGNGVKMAAGKPQRR